MNQWFDGQFEDGDVRRTVSDLLHTVCEEGGWTDVTAKKMTEAYGHLCEMALVKAQELFKNHNPTAPLVKEYLETPLSFDETRDKLDIYYTYHTAFMDIMMTLLLIRQVEEVGRTKRPFSIDFQRGVQTNAETDN